MKISMIGHASIFVETKDCKFMMDPVLWDPHQEGLFDICPKREIQYDEIPEFDILIISHKHLDHFDIRSLAFLPKNVDVIIPRDSLIERCLRKLGYQKIHSLSDFQVLSIGKTNIMTTRSENRVPEFGIIFEDQSGVFWNCVDTELTPDSIGNVLQHYPKIDFLLATWQPMMESNFQNNESIKFPYYEYGQILYNINLINPTAIAPGSNGFKYIDSGAWLNQIVFPVTRERFCKDISQAYPSLGNNIYALDPGDTIEFSHEKQVYTPNGCEFVQTIKDDRDQLDFCPINVGSSLVDTNSDGYDLSVVENTISDKVEIELTDLLQKKYKDFQEHKRWQVVYQLEVIFPNQVQKWYCDFSQYPFQMLKGRNPLANFYTCTTASGFYSLIKQTKGWDYLGLGGYHRSFNKIYQATPLGLVLPHYVEFIDPFSMLFSDVNLEVIMRDLEVKQWQDHYIKSKSTFQSKNVEIISHNSSLKFNSFAIRGI